MGSSQKSLFRISTVVQLFQVKIVCEGQTDSVTRVAYARPADLSEKWISYLWYHFS